MKPSITNLFTRPRANEGIELPVTTPDGQPVGANITIRGTDSDAFRIARAERSRESARILSLPENERALATREADIVLLSSLVLDWTFEEPCTPETVVNALRDAPALYDMIDSSAANRALFTTPRE